MKRITFYTNKRGEKVIIKKMSDSYLNNAIKFFNNRLELFEESNMEVAVCDEAPIIPVFIDTFNLRKIVESLEYEQNLREKSEVK